MLDVDTLKGNKLKKEKKDKKDKKEKKEKKKHKRDKKEKKAADKGDSSGDEVADIDKKQIEEELRQKALQSARKSNSFDA